MAHDDRQHYRLQSGRRESYRGEPYDYRRREYRRPGEDRDPGRAGDEARYAPDWRDRPEQRGFEGARSYPSGGYAEEFGRQRRPEADDYREREVGRPREVGSSYRRGGAYGRMRWGEHEDVPDYYGTGSHYGGGYGTAPSTRTSGAGTWGATGYAGQGAWSEDEDWLPENERAMSGEYASYGRSMYGAQSGYGRDYGSAEARRPDYRGRGPKGYARSDERLKEMICERLTDDPRIDASDVTVEVNQGIVRVTGAVGERRTKYEIEDLIERCGGVQDVDNQLRIRSSPLWSGADATSGASATRATEGRTTGGSTPRRS